MKNTALVSVIVPVFNTASYLPKALESLLQQTYGNLEIIVVDDGSTDGSGKICDEYSRKDKRIRVIHTANKGLSAARNTGMSHAKGTFISFVDSDDWISPQTIEKMYNTASQTKADVVAAGSSAEYINQSVQYNRRECAQVLQEQNILSHYAAGELRDVVWNKLYASSCFELLQFPEGQYYEDVEVTCRLMKHLAEHDGIVVKIPEVLFHQRMRKTSISHENTFCIVADRWHAYIYKFNSLPKYQKQLIPGCTASIGKMWSCYSGFTREEKAKVASVVQEMASFSKEYRFRILTGNYKLYTKSICLISQSKSPLLMWLCYKGAGMRRLLKKNKAAMFS